MIKVPLLRHQRYISPSPLTPRVETNDRIYQKKSWLWHLWWTCYGQFYWTKLSEYHSHTKYCKFDHSEMIFGPFEKLTFLGEHPLEWKPLPQRLIKLLTRCGTGNRIRTICQLIPHLWRLTFLRDSTATPNYLSQPLCFSSSVAVVTASLPSRLLYFIQEGRRWFAHRRKKWR